MNNTVHIYALNYQIPANEAENKIDLKLNIKELDTICSALNCLYKEDIYNKDSCNYINELYIKLENLIKENCFK